LAIRTAVATSFVDENQRISPTEEASTSKTEKANASSSTGAPSTGDRTATTQDQRINGPRTAGSVFRDDGADEKGLSLSATNGRAASSAEMVRRLMSAQ
jgi:hypothetical protein